VDEEIAFHIEMRTRELIDRGIDPRVAREMVLARVGDLGRLKRTCVGIGRKRDRKMRITQWLEECRDDVRFAVRQMRSAPGFALVAVLTLALGIGANSAIFALADAILLRPLPFTAPDRLMAVWERRGDIPRVPINPADFADWSERNRTFESMAAFLPSTRSLTGSDGVAEVVPGQAVTPRFFDLLGVKPIAGRTFVPADETDTPRSVVLSEGFWQSRFGGDPALVGDEIRIDGAMFTVIGVVPADFNLDAAGRSGRSRLWTLLINPRGRGPQDRYPHYLRVIGRLKPAVTPEAADADLNAIAESLAKDMAINQGHGVMLEPLRAGLVVPELRLTSLLLAGVVGFLLLMCCANVANLLLARTAVRGRELAVRSALGAGRLRVVRQLLVEGLVLAVLGGLAGAAVGAAILFVAPSWVPAGFLPAAMALTFDLRVLAFCALTSLAVAFAFGFVPAWQATGRSLAQAVALDGRTTTRRGAGFRSVLATGQVAVAVLLLCGAGLLLRTLVTLEQVEAGHRARNVLTMIVSPGMGKSPEVMRRFYDAVEQEVRNVPGVRSLGLGTALPFDGQWYTQGFDIVGDPARPPTDRLNAGYHMVSPTYFSTMGIGMIRGREFNDRDTSGSPEVCIVNEAFVRRHLAGREPIGMRVSVNAMVTPTAVITREIVGVVAQVKERPDEAEPAPHIYVPIAQNTWWSASLVVEPAAGDAAALVPAVRAAVARVDKDRPVTAVRTLAALDAEATRTPRFRAALVATFAALALLLAMVGVFGVLACSVAQRTREFGVRIALGSTAGQVLRLVLAGAARVTVAGGVVGLVAAAMMTRWIATLLFGVTPLDPVTFTMVAVIIGATAAVAAAVPAWRAARVDPVMTFREE
jgi:putative ABC transport system permease protein